MGIWIRSQNQKVLAAFNGFVNEKRHEEQCVIGKPEDATDPKVMLGKYASEEEALKVLDMLQDKISSLAYVQFYKEDSDFVNPILQMPGNGFSAKSEKFHPDCAADLNHCGLLDGTAPEGRTCYLYDECKAAYDRGRW